MSITLKDRLNANVVYNLVDRRGGTATFAATADSLLARPRLVLTLTEKESTNRVIGKLSIPSMLDCTDTCAKPSISFTEVGSFDLSAVTFATADAANDFHSQFATLVASDAVKNMFLSAAMPS